MFICTATGCQTADAYSSADAFRKGCAFFGKLALCCTECIAAVGTLCESPPGTS